MKMAAAAAVSPARDDIDLGPVPMVYQAIHATSAIIHCAVRLQYSMGRVGHGAVRGGGKWSKHFLVLRPIIDLEVISD
jgi:hypothetical protein